MLDRGDQLYNYRNFGSALSITFIYEYIVVIVMLMRNTILLIIVLLMCHSCFASPQGYVEKLDERIQENTGRGALFTYSINLSGAEIFDAEVKSNSTNRWFLKVFKIQNGQEELLDKKTGGSTWIGGEKNVSTKTYKGPGEYKVKISSEYGPIGPIAFPDLSGVIQKLEVPGVAIWWEDWDVLIRKYKKIDNVVPSRDVSSSSKPNTQNPIPTHPFREINGYVKYLRGNAAGKGVNVQLLEIYNGNIFNVGNPIPLKSGGSFKITYCPEDLKNPYEPDLWVLAIFRGIPVTNPVKIIGSGKQSVELIYSNS